MIFKFIYFCEATPHRSGVASFSGEENENLYHFMDNSTYSETAPGYGKNKKQQFNKHQPIPILRALASRRLSCSLRFSGKKVRLITRTKVQLSQARFKVSTYCLRWLVCFLFSLETFSCECFPPDYSVTTSPGVALLRVGCNQEAIVTFIFLFERRSAHQKSWKRRSQCNTPGGRLKKMGVDVWMLSFRFPLPPSLRKTI